MRWRLIPNPNGAGVVRAQDPERIDWVRGMAERALRGDTVYSICRWLDSAGAPRPSTRSPGKTWAYSTVDRLLDNPVLAGLTACNPGNSKGGVRGPELLRDDNGVPIVNGELAIISVEEHERLVHMLRHKPHGASRPVRDRRSTSPLLSKLATCADCGQLMWRFGYRRASFALRCNKCGQTIAYHALVRHLEDRVLSERGHLPMYRRAVVIQDDPSATVRLASIDHALRSAAFALTGDGANVTEISREISLLKAARARAYAKAKSAPIERRLPIDRKLADVWFLSCSDEQRREILLQQIKSLLISRGHHTGCRLDTSRVHLAWRGRPMTLVPDGILLDGPHSYVRPKPEWISTAEAMKMADCSEWFIRKAVREGEIEQRQVARRAPSLSCASVERFARERRTAAG